MACSEGLLTPTRPHRYCATPLIHAVASVCPACLQRGRWAWCAAKDANDLHSTFVVLWQRNAEAAPVHLTPVLRIRRLGISRNSRLGI